MEEEPEFSDAEVTKILKEALTMKIKEKRSVPSKVQLNRALVSTMKEFLACFRLIGYDLEGNPVNLLIHSDALEKSALDNAFMTEIGKFMAGGK